MRHPLVVTIEDANRRGSLHGRNWIIRTRAASKFPIPADHSPGSGSGSVTPWRYFPRRRNRRSFYRRSSHERQRYGRGCLMHSPDLAPFSSLAADGGTHATAYQALVDRSAGCSTHDDRMLRAAVAYGKFGWPIFPCAGKIPAIKGGRGCHDATTDPERIAAMWRRYPGSNIGVATGQHADFWVLYVDPRHGGDASLVALQQEHGPLPPTVEQHTGSGGRHRLFRYDAMRRVRNRAGFGLGSILAAMAATSSSRPRCIPRPAGGMSGCRSDIQCGRQSPRRRTGC